MKTFPALLIVASLTGAAGLWAAPGCSSAPASNFGGGGDSGDSDAGIIDPADEDGGGLIINGDAAVDVVTCTGLECQVVNCSNGNHTTISGTVYDPMGRNPLYNVYVYVPNAPLLDIASGAVCTSCQAPASGSPLPSAVQTDAKGHFTIVDAPVGTNIPLVMQLGKFRRVITIPSVPQCVDTALGKKDGSGFETITRLPKKQKEGSPFDNLPQLAMATGGCDKLECLMRKIGIDDSEFSAAGRVHLFTGSGGASGPGSKDAYAFWANKAELTKHDIVINSCECSPVDRKPQGYQAMHDYVNGGGRLFGTHYHYNWFAPGNGQADFNSTAQWLAPGPSNGPPWYINTTFPKGVAFDAWVQNVFKGAPPSKGQITLDYAAHDVGIVTGATTPWIYYGDQNLKNKAYNTAYLSFNAPVNAQPAAQCGLAVFSDLHVSSGGGSLGPLGDCGDAKAAMTQQEAALEFLFFDLSSCVGDPTKPPPPPPPN